MHSHLIESHPHNAKMTMTQPSCLICNKVDVQQCRQCKNVFYCSTECQKRDWPTHKLLCSKYSTFDKSTRPSDDHFLAIHFPVTQTQPELVWLRTKDGPKSPVNVEAYIESGLGATVIDRNTYLDREQPNDLVLLYRDAFLLDGSLVNKSIARIRSLQDFPGRTAWRGPVIAFLQDVVVVSSDSSYSENHIFTDVNMTSFRDIVDYLRIE